MFSPTNRIADFLEPPPREPTWADLLVQFASQLDIQIDYQNGGYNFALLGKIPAELDVDTPDRDSLNMVANLIARIHCPDKSNPTLGPNLPRIKGGAK